MALEDATIERAAPNRLVVVARGRHDVNEELVVHVPSGGGMVSRNARVVSSDAVSVAGTVHFRLELAFLPSADDAA